MPLRAQEPTIATLTSSTYELSFEGRVDDEVLATFEGVHITTDGTSLTLCARVRDPEALQGLLLAARQLGLQIVRVRPLDP